MTRLKAAQVQNERFPFHAGPNTIVGLGKPDAPDFIASKLVANLVPAYVELLKALKDLGVPEVQIHENILTLPMAGSLQKDFEATYAELAKVGVPINLVAAYDDIGEAYPWVVKLPVQVSDRP